MTLGEHLRELRNRIIVAALAFVVVTAVAWFFYHPIFEFLTRPFCQLQAQGHHPAPAGATSTGGSPGCPLYFTSIFQPFLLRLKVSAMVAVVASSPIWFYQLWAFITPGLHRNERKWTIAFVSTAVPLFLVGAVLAYLVLSKGLHLLLSFVPEDYGTLITIDHYFGYAAAMMAIFGVGFELPLLVVLLNLAGVLTFERLKKWQRRSILLIFVFAAVATPSQDPFSMLALALPMTALFEAAVVVAYLNDKRRGVGSIEAAYDELDDDEASPLELDAEGSELDDDTSRKA
jgi:sec-independent protein translocase protein TatC